MPFLSCGCTTTEASYGDTTQRFTDHERLMAHRLRAMFTIPIVDGRTLPIVLNPYFCKLWDTMYHQKNVAEQDVLAATCVSEIVIGRGEKYINLFPEYMHVYDKICDGVWV